MKSAGHGLFGKLARCRCGQVLYVEDFYDGMCVDCYSAMADYPQQAQEQEQEESEGGNDANYNV